MTINTKNSYFAKGDTIVGGGEGPDEPVVSSTQIMTATRFAAMQTSDAELRRFAQSAIQHGGADIAKKGRLFESVTVVAGANPSTITIAPIASYDSAGKNLSGYCPQRPVDGNVLAQKASGFVLDTDNLTHFVNLPYEDGVGLEYNIGIAISTVPSKAEINPRTGKYQLTQETAVVGVAAVADVVTYNAGLNLITMTLDTDELVGGTSSLAGRAAMAWFIDSTGHVKGDTATAIQFGTMTWSGTNNELTLPGAFGQDVSSVDTTASRYFVCILGPAVFEGGIDTDTNGLAWIAHGDNDTAWVTDGQNRYPSVFHMLQNFVRMSLPSVSSPDLVSNPKISIRPNDNEPGSERQIEVWKDAAATSLAFAVDKDGNIFFDGDLLGVGATPFSFGVDTATAGVESGLEVFHTESGGVGIVGKGVRIELSCETSVEGVREPVGAISAIIRDVTGAAVDGDLVLSAYGGSSEVQAFLISEHGETFVGTSILSQIGASAPANHYDPHADGALSAGLYAVGNATNRVGSFNTTPQDGAGARDSRVSFAGTTLAGVVHEQALFLTTAAVAGTGTESVVSLYVHNGTTLSEATQTGYFDDWDNPGVQAGMGFRTNHLRPLAGGVTPIRLSLDQAVRSGDETHFEIVQNSSSNTAAMIAANASARLAWRVIAADPVDVEVFHISVAPVLGGYEARFSGDGGVEQLLMNLKSDSTVLATRVEIQSLGTGGTPDPFTTENKSPLQVLHNDSGDKYGGIDIGNRTAGNVDGDRSSGINFLGLFGAVEVRLGGIRTHYDGDFGGGNFREGKMTLFTNDGTGTGTVTNGIEIYSDGYVRSPNTAAWASVTHGAPPTYDSTKGFDTVTAITNPATGRYILTLKTAMIGATLNDPIFVGVKTDFFSGRGFWVTTSTIEVRIWDGSGALAPVLANDDFFVQAYAGANLKVAP